MLNDQQIHEIHRLHWHQNWSLRQIAGHLDLNRRTVAKYLIQPAQPAPRPQRTSKLEPFHAAVAELREEDPHASAVVILQRLRGRGFDGGITILKDYLHQVRTQEATRRAYLRLESPPGDRFQIDWGATAVAEHEGSLVRFHPRFLAFAREFGFLPQAGHVASPWEKGKVERAGIGYLRQNFWPLRTFSHLADVNRQVRQWLDEVANQRLHRETRERPDQRFLPESLLPAPALLPDYRDTADALVRKALRLDFDGNRYCVPARYVGCRLTVKADSQSLTIYDQHREVATYPRCWRRGQTLGAERFQKELLDQRLVAQLGARAFGSGPRGRPIANILRQQSSPRSVEPPVRLRDPRLNQLATDQLSRLEYDAFLLEDPEKEEL